MGSARYRRIMPLAVGSVLVVAFLGSMVPTAPAAGSSRGAPTAQQSGTAKNLTGVKQEIFQKIDGRRQFTATVVDTLFSIPELGFQEFETVKYVTEILEKNGFRVQRGQAGIPTAFTAVWGSGKPDIGLMADIDALPQTSQKPGVAYHDPLVPRAPGHGEGHNAGSAVVLTAALALKEVMTERSMPGTIRVLPGIADEIGGIRGYLYQHGVFEGMDLLLVVHQGNTFGSSWGEFGSGFISTEFSFHGVSAHSAAYFWRGRSALDAVELMNSGWNFRREHLPLSQRSHYVITDGGDQPNVIPPEASVWYFLDDIDPDRIKALHKTAQEVARAAADMTGTTVTERVLGASWRRNPNETLAKLLHSNARLVGMPNWSEADLALARAVQRELQVPQIGLNTTVAPQAGQSSSAQAQTGGPPSDLGDLTWNLPVGNLTYPSGYIPGNIVHHWSATVPMATPIAHKGATVGAKALAATVLDLVQNPEHLNQAKATFAQQTKGVTWKSLLPPDYKPPIDLYAEKMQRFRPLLAKYRYDSTRYKSYLDQLGIQYPTVRTNSSEARP